MERDVSSGKTGRTRLRTFSFYRLAPAALLSIALAPPCAALDPVRAITQYVHDVWQTQQGLPQDTVQSILRSRDGYLWLATQAGLARFDGVKFATFNRRNTPAIGNNSILHLVEDSDGAVWFGTDGGGLVRVKDGVFRAYTTKDGLPSDRVEELGRGRDGDLWLAARNRLFRFRSGRVVPFDLPKDFSCDWIELPFEASDGSLWMSTNRGLVRVRGGRVTIYPAKDPSGSDKVRSIFEDREGTVWVGRSNGTLLRFQGEETSLFGPKNGIPNNPIQAICDDRDGNLWLACNGGGLVRFRGGRADVYTVANGLSSNRAYSLREDGDGSLWVGTNGGGLNRFRDGKFTTYGRAEGLAGESVMAVFQDRAGRIWIGTHGGGAARLETGRLENFSVRDGLPDDMVVTLGEDEDRSILFGTYTGGLAFLTAGRFHTLTTKDGLPTNIVRSLFTDRDGSLWIGTNAGLVHRTRGRFAVFPQVPASDNIDAIEPGRDGSLWIGTRGGGLYKIKGNRTAHYTKKDGLSSDLIWALHEDERGTLWIGTFEAGLDRFADGRFTTFSSKDGFPDDSIYTILEDGSNHLWLGSYQGIFRVAIPDLEAAARGSRKPLDITVFDESDGLRSRDCSGGYQPSGWRDRDGRLWFATLKGASVIDPARVPFDRTAPPVRVEEVRVDGRPLARGRPAVVPPGRKSFEFDYTALSLVAPARVKFEYKLEGFDRDWVRAGARRIAYYTGLSHGSYTFRVKACNEDGVWNEAGAAFPFVVRPFFRQTPWFFALCALAIAASGFATQRARVHGLKKRQKELLTLVEERTRSLAEEKRRTEEANRAKSLFLASMSHELRTPLNAVLGFVQLIGRDTALKAEHREHLSIITQSGEHLLNLINDVLSISRIESGQLALREEAFDLSELLAGLKEVYAARAAARGLRLKVEVAPERPPRLLGDAGKLRQVLINLLENAFRFTESGGIELAARWAEGTAVFAVEDTGRGMSAEDRARIFQIFGQAQAGEQSKAGSGLGLYISRSFVRRMGGEIEVESAPGKGTRFSFQIPLPAAPAAARVEKPPARVLALAPGQRKLRVLVADDLAENRKLLVRLLTEVGLEVREAVDGAEAVEALESDRPDVILMDIRMPVLDGYAATRQIRNAEKRGAPTAPRTVIIGLSASAFDHDREAVLAAGCDDFLAKPFRESQLFELIERHAGVEFLREPASRAEDGAAVEPILTRARLSLLPADLRTRLKESLEQGDLQGARTVVEEIRASDAVLAAVLTEAIREYRLDRLLDLTQGAAT